MTPRAGLLALLLASPGIAQAGGANVLPLLSLSAPAQGPGPQAAPALLPDGSNLFEMVAMHWGKTPIVANRFYTLHVDAKHIYRYSEVLVVEKDPQKGWRFSLRLREVIGGPGVNLHLRRRAFAQRSGFLYHFRDFRVHDPVLARQNYRVVPMGALLRGGRRLLLFDILPRRHRTASYRILVDAQTAMVLDQIEFTPDRRVASTLFYDETLRIGPAAVSPPLTRWWRPWMEVKEHRSVAGAARVAGFLPRTPRQVGDGFRLHAPVRTTHRRDKTFAVLTYTDGIDTRFVIQSLATKAEQRNVLGPGGNLPTVAAPVLPVLRYRMGPVTQFLVQDSDGLEILVVGTFREPGVPKLLQSLVGQ